MAAVRGRLISSFARRWARFQSRYLLRHLRISIKHSRYSEHMRRTALVAIVLCFTLSAPAQVGPYSALFPLVIKFIGMIFHRSPSTVNGVPSVTQIPGLAIDIPDASVHQAKQPCANWTWAAAVETMVAP